MPVKILEKEFPKLLFEDHGVFDITRMFMALLQLHDLISEVIHPHANQIA